MARPKVLVTRRMDQDALDMIAGETDLEVWPEEGPPSPEVLRSLVRDVEGVLTNIMDRVDAPLLEAAPHLKVVSHLAVGVDSVDVGAVTGKGIPLGYTPGGAVQSHGRPGLRNIAGRRPAGSGGRPLGAGRRLEAGPPPSLLAGR